MLDLMLAVFTVCAFCLCCRCLMKAATSPLPVRGEVVYRRSALRVQKGYAVFAWALMTGTFLFSLVVSFIQVYTTL